MAYNPPKNTIPAKVLDYLRSQPPGTRIASAPLLAAIGVDHIAGGLQPYLRAAMQHGAIGCVPDPADTRRSVWFLGDGTPSKQRDDDDDDLPDKPVTACRPVLRTNPPPVPPEVLKPPAPEPAPPPPPPPGIDIDAVHSRPRPVVMSACSTCAYSALPPDSDPCSACSGNSRWQAAPPDQFPKVAGAPEDAAPLQFERREPPMRTAVDLLGAAQGHMTQRATTYDQLTGERSMGKTIKAFNTITGHSLRESEGWLLLGLLKMVRSETRARPHTDSVEDLIAYAALYGEARLDGR